MTEATSSAQAVAEFEREERYIVIKRKHLVEDEERQLRDCLYRLNVCPVECVVVESDWPEYEIVWDMIEARCTPAAPSSSVVEAVAKVIFEADPDVGTTWEEWVAYAEAHPSHLQSVEFVRRQARAVAAMPAASEGEPVAWMFKSVLSDRTIFSAKRSNCPRNWIAQPVYAHPAPSDQDKLVGELVEALLEAHAGFVGIEKSRGRREYIRSKARVAKERAGAVLNRILPLTRARQTGEPS